MEKWLWRTLSKSSGLVIKATITLPTLDENNRNIKQKHPDTIYESGHLNGGYSMRGKNIEGLVGCSLAQNEYQKRSTGKSSLHWFHGKTFCCMIIYSVFQITFAQGFVLYHNGSRLIHQKYKTNSSLFHKSFSADMVSFCLYDIVFIPRGQCLLWCFCAGTMVF